MEEWRPAPGFEDHYSVSTLGNVRGEPRRVARLGTSGDVTVHGKTLTPHVDKRGYANVTLTKNGHRRTVRVHVLVLETFVGQRPNGMHGCHRNGDQTDNRLSNLRWGTPSSNQLDTVAHGTHAFARRTTCPRGHLLANPNLVASTARRGYRDCLSCNRARTRANNWSRRRRVLLDWRAEADNIYADIMVGELDRGA